MILDLEVKRWVFIGKQPLFRFLDFRFQKRCQVGYMGVRLWIDYLLSLELKLENVIFLVRKLKIVLSSRYCLFINVNQKHS